MSSYVLLLLVIIPLAGSFFALTAKNDRNYAAENVYKVSILSLMLNVGMVLYGFSIPSPTKKGQRPSVARLYLISPS